MDRFLKYTTGKEPVITVNVIAALGLGLFVLMAERLGVTFTEVELGVLGSAFFIGATWLARSAVFSPETYYKDVDEALQQDPPTE